MTDEKFWEIIDKFRDKAETCRKLCCVHSCKPLAWAFRTIKEEEVFEADSEKWRSWLKLFSKLANTLQHSGDDLPEGPVEAEEDYEDEGHIDVEACVTDVPTTPYRPPEAKPVPVRIFDKLNERIRQAKGRE